MRWRVGTGWVVSPLTLTLFGYFVLEGYSRDGEPSDRNREKKGITPPQKIAHAPCDVHDVMRGVYKRNDPDTVGRVAFCLFQEM